MSTSPSVTARQQIRQLVRAGKAKDATIREQEVTIAEQQQHIIRLSTDPTRILRRAKHRA
jgi:hypothetical protein